MLSKLIEFSLHNRMLVVCLVLLMSGLGVYSALGLPIDAVPDLTNVQVQIVTDAGALSPLEVEQYVTYPVEQSMTGLPDVEEVRSVSRLGISAVTVVFRERTDIYRARQLVTERLPDAAEKIPAGYGTPRLNPLATVVIGGLIASTLLTTFVLPTIYPWFVSKPRSSSFSDVGVTLL